MTHRARIVSFLSFLPILCMSSSAMSLGWTGHWRVTEAQWDTLSRNVCASVGITLAVAPARLTDAEAAYLAGLGAIFSDIGYVLPQHKRFSDLVHYIGTGSFTDNLTKIVCESSRPDARMLAFAAGFRTHYWADRIGHHLGTNRAVALLLARAKSGQERIVYEEDVETHEKVELAAFMVSDVKHGTVRIATSFIGRAGSKDYLGQVAEAVRKALARTYDEATAEAAPRMDELVMFTFGVAKRTCDIAEEIYKSGIGGDQDRPLADVRKSCRDKGPLEVKPPTPDLHPLDKILVGIKFFVDFPKMIDFYNESIVALEARFRHVGLESLPNINLDTDLPSAGGQYRTADSVYRTLHHKAEQKCDQATFAKAASGQWVDWRRYQDVAICIDGTVRRNLSSAACGELPHWPDLVAIGAGWLRGLLPHPSGLPLRVGTVDVLGTTFTSDSFGDIRAVGGASPIAFLYACEAAAAPGNAQSGGAAAEARDRLRLGDPIDPATGLYKP